MKNIKNESTFSLHNINLNEWKSQVEVLPIVMFVKVQQCILCPIRQ